MVDSNRCKEEERDIVEYGLRIGIEILFNILMTIIITFLFGMVLETLVFYISFFYLLSYCGGIGVFLMSTLFDVEIVIINISLSITITTISLILGKIKNSFEKRGGIKIESK